MPNNSISLKRSTDFEAVVCFLEENFSSPTHWPDWNQWVSEQGNSDLFYWFLFEGKELVAICPVHSYIEEQGNKQLISGQYRFIPYGGWLAKKHLDYSRIPIGSKQLEAFQSHSLPLLPEFNVEYEEGLHEKQTLIVDLKGKTEEDIWSQAVHSKRRNMIRKAEKMGIEVREVSSEKEFEDFYDVYCQASKRNDLKVLERSFFKKFQDSSNINLKLLNAYKGDQILSNVGLVLDKDYAIYWLGNNADDVRNEGQGDLLQWASLKTALAAGCSFYDLCYIEPERLPLIYKFKKGFSKQEAPIAVTSHKSIFLKALMKIKKTTSSK